jgi:hypothetical protein
MLCTYYDKSFKITIISYLTGRRQFLSLIKLLKSLLEVITIKNLLLMALLLLVANGDDGMVNFVEEFCI